MRQRQPIVAYGRFSTLPARLTERKFHGGNHARTDRFQCDYANCSYVVRHSARLCREVLRRILPRRLPNRSVQELVSKHLRAEMPHEPSRSLNVQASASQPSNQNKAPGRARLAPVGSASIRRTTALPVRGAVRDSSIEDTVVGQAESRVRFAPMATGLLRRAK